MTGVRAALGPASGREAAPVRSALLGSVIAVVVVAASITFGSSLSFLVSRPALYGWNWDYALLAGFSAAENLPAAETASLLSHDPVVAHWTGVYFEHMKLDGQGVPVLASSPSAPVGPPLLSGHGLQAASQAGLGPATLARLTTRRRHGRATPARAAGPPDHRRHGHVAHHRKLGLPFAADGHRRDRRRGPFPGPGPGPAGPPCRARWPCSSRSGPASPRPRRSAHSARSPRLSTGHRTPTPRSAAWSPPSAQPRSPTTAPPARMPAVLAAVLAAAAISALGLTLIASVRHRRREFALLKTLGFTQRQLAATVAWQSSVPAIIGVIFGLPLGIAIGRWLWTLFARGSRPSPTPTCPCCTWLQSRSAR